MPLSYSLAYGLYQLIQVQGALIQYTSVTKQTGAANPAVNPPNVEQVILSSAVSAGASSVNMSGMLITGSLIAGDQFQIAGDDTTYTVTAPVTSPLDADTFTDVPITPVLTQDEAEGAAITFTAFASTTLNLPALVTDFPARLVNGTSIQQKDHRVRFLANAYPDMAGSFAGTPSIGDRVTMPDGEVQSVIYTSHMETQGVHYGWALQVRA